MKEIILIVLICGLFIFFIFTFTNLIKKKKEDAKPSADKKEEKKPDNKESIPDIIKEVTMGNYMHDISQQTSMQDGVEFVENSMVEKTENIVVDAKNKIVDAFDEIQEIGDDIGDEIVEDIEGIEDIEDSIIDELDEDFSDTTLLGSDDYEEDFNLDNKPSKNNIVSEYKKLSKEMKTLLIADILKKKK